MTATLQRLARANGTPSGSYAEFTAVRTFEADDMADAISRVGSDGLWAGDDQAEQCDDGQRLPLCSDDGQQWYLHLTE